MCPTSEYIKILFVGGPLKKLSFVAFMVLFCWKKTNQRRYFPLPTAKSPPNKSLKPKSRAKKMFYDLFSSLNFFKGRLWFPISNWTYNKGRRPHLHDQNNLLFSSIPVFLVNSKCVTFDTFESQKFLVDSSTYFHFFGSICQTHFLAFSVIYCERDPQQN